MTTKRQMATARRRNWAGNKAPRHTISFEERFWEKVYPEPNTGCWLWGGNDRNGYGQFEESPLSGTRTAHRIAYELMVGRIAEGMQIDHLCRQRSCVRPDHLEVVTQRENMLRSHAPNMLVRNSGFCRRGHPQTDRDRRSDGRATCLQCKREAETAKRRADGVLEGSYWARKTTCPNGHPYDVFTADGKRRCRRCVNAQTNARRARQRADRQRVTEGVAES